MTSLLDVFMPNDLCARCDEEEAQVKYSFTAMNQEETCRISFCSPDCMGAFWRGWEASKTVRL